VSLSWHGGPNGLPSLPLAGLLVAAAGLSLYVSSPTIVAVFDGSYVFDWTNFIEAGERFGTGTLYDIEPPYAFRWSPVAAWLLGFITLMPLWLWQLLHLAALLLIRPWLLAVAVLVSYPFWFDVQTGNVMTFVAVAGLLALRGGRVATAVFLVLTVLIPRPLMIPLAVWLLWKRPETRLPFLAFFAVHAVVVVALGYAADWLTALTSVQVELVNAYNFGPSRLIGALWIPIGLALAACLTWRGRLGLASLAISPYWLPYYFLMLILEFARGEAPVRVQDDRGRQEGERAGPQPGERDQHADGEDPGPAGHGGHRTDQDPGQDADRQGSQEVDRSVGLDPRAE
jgi:hypothetical protein